MTTPAPHRCNDNTLKLKKLTLREKSTGDCDRQEEEEMKCL